MSSRFLQALRAAVMNEKVQWEEPLEEAEWQELFHQAEIHKVMPLIVDAVYSCGAAQLINPEVWRQLKRRIMQQVMMQTMKSEEFLGLYKSLREAGVRALVVKGIVCRELYPNPDYRTSGDEDVLIPEAQYALCHEVMTDYGMVPSDPEMDRDAAYEVPYGKQGHPIYIELHKHLFPPESDAYGDLNRFFAGVHERAVEITVNGVPIATMCPTDHFFYLICHSFKHFLHSGFGLRQVCDIVMYANAYGAKIDWKQLLKQCKEIRADRFTAALLKIGEKHLVLNREKACLSDAWCKLIDTVDETAMLEDLMDSGIYGDASMSRKHSSNMTLNAVTADKQGVESKGGVIRMLFPGVGTMRGRYPYLKKHPYLLPVAWIQRIVKYRKETKAAKAAGVESANSASESLRVGSQRIALLKKYGIIKK